MRSIYLCGKAGAGKSISADYLKKKYGFQTAKFAYPVYNLAYNYFNMQGKDRKLLQVIGSDVGRDMVDPNLWVSRFSQDMRIIQETCKKMGKPQVQFISDDCRFANEHRTLKALGWVGLYLYVDDATRIARLKGRDGTAQIETLNHPSELAVETFYNDLYWIDSTCDAQQLYLNLDEAVDKLCREDV